MKKTGLFDRKGKEICEGYKIGYTQHKGVLIDSFTAFVHWMPEYACFGYQKAYNSRIIPFAEHHELKHDILDYCEIIK